MKETVNELLELLKRFLQAVFYAVEYVYDWSIGQVITTIGLAASFPQLPLWKQVLVIVVVVALIWLLYQIIMSLAGALTGILIAVVSFLGALIANLPQILIAGVIAFGGAWVINNVDIPALERVRLID